jgi:hypothetical protein
MAGADWTSLCANVPIMVRPSNFFADRDLGVYAVRPVIDNSAVKIICCIAYVRFWG